MRRWLIVVAVLLIAIGVLDLVSPVHGPAYRSTTGASLVRFTLHSRETKRDLHEILVLPHTGQAAFLLVLLHGRGASPSSWLSQPFFDELHALGPRAPAVLLLDGGDHSYWHDRQDGRWGAMVLHEAIPAGLARTHAKHVAIGGISMGGFGALDLGARDTFCAVGGHSAALWLTAGETPPGAFDDAADFARHDLIRHPPAYRAPVWMDVGTDDPFRAADTALAAKLGVKIHVWPGAHDGGYWNRHMAQYLRFYANACG